MKLEGDEPGMTSTSSNGIHCLLPVHLPHIHSAPFRTRSVPKESTLTTSQITMNVPKFNEREKALENDYIRKKESDRLPLPWSAGYTNSGTQGGEVQEQRPKARYDLHGTAGKCWRTTGATLSPSDELSGLT
jgi:hypothetical protein